MLEDPPLSFFADILAKDKWDFFVDQGYLGKAVKSNYMSFLLEFYKYVCIRTL